MNDYGKTELNRPMAKKSLMDALAGLREKADCLASVQNESEHMVSMLKMQANVGKERLAKPVQDIPTPVAPDILDMFYAVISVIGEKTALIAKNIEEVKQMIE